MANSSMQGLPVAGYKPQSKEAVDLVNLNKELEERVLRRIDALYQVPGTEKEMLHRAYMGVQESFMWLNRAVFQPGRATLPEDDADLVA